MSNDTTPPEQKRESSGAGPPQWQARDAAHQREELARDALRQSKSIFVFSVCFILLGFGVMLMGVVRELWPTLFPMGDESYTALEPALLATVAGVVTQVIGASLLFLGNTGARHATADTMAPEWINSLAVAMSLLDRIPDRADGTLKDQTTAAVVKALVTPRAEESTDDSAKGEKGDLTATPSADPSNKGESKKKGGSEQ